MAKFGWNVSVVRGGGKLAAQQELLGLNLRALGILQQRDVDVVGTHDKQGSRDPCPLPVDRNRLVRRGNFRWTESKRKGAGNRVGSDRHDAANRFVVPDSYGEGPEFGIERGQRRGPQRDQLVLGWVERWQHAPA